MPVRRTLALGFLAGLALSFTSFAASAMAPQPTGTLVKVPLDIDVYDQPGGEGESSHFIAAGSEIFLLEERADHWCHVQEDKGGTGWIWCGEGEDGQDYSLQPVQAGGGGGGGGEGGGMVPGAGEGGGGGNAE